jgi:hypothetical protein
MVLIHEAWQLRFNFAAIYWVTCFIEDEIKIRMLPLASS